MYARLLPRILAVAPLALAAFLASCGTTGAARVADPEPVAAPPRDRTPDRPPEPPPAPPAPDPCPGGGCRSLQFFRPAGCSTPVRSGWRRVVRECASEERLEVLVRPDGSVATRPLPPGPSRAPYPVELARQWRRCPAGREAARGANAGLDPARFGTYEDPEVGPCLVLRDLDPARVAAARKPARLSLLDNLHPVIAEATTRLVLAAEEEGIRVKVISGLRPYTKKVVSAWKTVKSKDGTKKRVKYRKTVHRKGLHAWGLAVDVNLAHRNDLASASAAYVRGGEEREAWDRIGDLGEAFGLRWLGHGDPGEIFHFEWHPTWPGRPKGALLGRLNATQRKEGLPGVWKLLRREAGKTAFEHLEDR